MFAQYPSFSRALTALLLLGGSLSASAQMSTQVRLCLKDYLMLSRSGDTAGALDRLRQCAEENPAEFTLQKTLGEKLAELHESNGDTALAEEAVLAYEAAMEINPAEAPSLWGSLASVQDALGRDGDAIHSWEQALPELWREERWRAQDGLWRLYRSTGQDDKALELWPDVSYRQSNDFASVSYAARLHEDAGRGKEAEMLQRRALTLQPSESAADEALPTTASAADSATSELRILEDPGAWLAMHGFGLFDLFVLAFNVALFFFAGTLVRHIGVKSSDAETLRRANRLRIANLVLFLLYFVAYFVSDLARPLAQSGLTMLLGVLAGTFVNGQAVRRYGREREIEGVAHHSGTYQSQLFTMLGIGIVVVICGLTILNIWGRDHWLQATSVLGGLLVALYATKESWLPDNISALILLHDGEVQPGAVIQCEELGLLGIALRTSLTRTTFKDLVHRHEVVIPNRRLRSARIDVLSRGPEAGCWRYADFNIGYDADPAAVGALLQDIWGRACELEKGINAERQPKLRVLANGDHAVTWRLFYSLGNVYRLLPARYAVEQAALLASREAGISLATPTTHQVELSPPSSADPA